MALKTLPADKDGNFIFYLRNVKICLEFTKKPFVDVNSSKFQISYFSFEFKNRAIGSRRPSIYREKNLNYRVPFFSIPYTQYSV